MNKFYVTVVAFLYLIGCTHTKQFSSYDEINSYTEGKIVQIKLYDEKIIKGKNIHLSTDSTFWVDTKNKNTYKLPTSEIIAIRTINRPQGANTGFISFTIFGVIVGVLTYLTADFSDCWLFCEGEVILIGSAMGTTLGIFVGIPMGALIGSKNVYYVNPNLSSSETTKW